MNNFRVAVACRRMSGFGGATTVILEQSKRMLEAGWAVDLFAEEIDRARVGDARVRLLPRLPLGSTWKRLFFANAFAWVTRNQKYDIVHGHGDILNQDILTLHNCVHTAHEIINGAPAPDRGVALMHKRQLREQRFKILIANSNLMKKDVISRFGVPDDKIRVVYPGCDLTRFRVHDRPARREKMRETLRLRPDHIAIGLVTSGDLKKRGVDIFIETLARLSPAARDKTIGVLIGKESQLKPYEQQIRELGLGERLRFAPPIAAVENYYHALDIFFYPALFEEFGLSVLEAMACGLPILTSRRVGATELMTGPIRDFFPEKPEATVFSNVLENWIGNDDLRRCLAMEGPGFCAQNTWDRYANSVMGIYRSVTP